MILLLVTIRVIVVKLEVANLYASSHLEELFKLIILDLPMF